MSIRVLVADDETLMRRLIVRRLAQEPDIEVVGEAENGRRAVEMAQTCSPDVILMDLQMPVMNGAQATERILSQRPHIRIVMLTMLQELAEIGRLHGAALCLDKSCTPEELVSAVRTAVLSRESPVRSSVGDYTGAVDRLAGRAGMTERERIVVLKAVTTELTIRQMSAALTVELKASVSESAVKHALERAMTKLRIEPRTRAALVKHVLEFDKSYS